MRVGMFTPTVVVGLLVYGLLSRRGPLGSLDLLYTKGAIVAGEFLLAFPLLVTLVHGTVAALDRRVPETARTLGARRLAASCARSWARSASAWSPPIWRRSRAASPSSAWP